MRGSCPAYGNYSSCACASPITLFVTPNWGARSGVIVLWLVILGVAFSLLKLSQFLLSLVRSPEIVQYIGVDFKPFLSAIPVLTLSALFVATLLTSFGVLLQALYLSNDMDFLLSTPIPIRSVFIAKLLQAVLPNFSLIALFGIPILFGLGISSGYTFIYYPLVIIMMIALALSAAGLSSLLVMLVVRVLPPRRAAEILGFIGAVIGFSCRTDRQLQKYLWQGRRFFRKTVYQFIDAFQYALAATQLGWAGSGRFGRRSLACGSLVGWRHACVDIPRVLVRARHCRATVLFRLGWDAGGRPQKSRLEPGVECERKKQIPPLDCCASFRPRCWASFKKIFLPSRVTFAICPNWSHRSSSA